MISYRLALSCCFLLVATSVAHASDFAGRFIDDLETGATLDLKPSENGNYTGSLSMDGYVMPLTGNATGASLEGSMDDGGETIFFRGELAEDTLVLNLTLPQFPDQVMETLRFVRAGSAASTLGAASQSSQAAEPQSRSQASGSVVINGRTLNAEAVALLETTYGVRPRPGNYWYDAVSGLYGVVGHQAYGYMYPGHEFGQLDGNVSNGNTGVYVNGRHLPQSEWLIWSYMLGAGIQPGAYWLDAQGNAGNVGNPVPTVNLFAAARQNAYRGQGGSGDNAWSTRFSAGNSNADNSQGYVSVPGYGPVGYGF